MAEAMIKAENCASRMPLLKVQEPGESNAAIAPVSHGNRFANSNSVGFPPYSGEATAEGTFTTSTSQQTRGPLLPSSPGVVYGFLATDRQRGVCAGAVDFGLNPPGAVDVSKPPLAVEQ
jgi:hypothetical protein